MENVSAMTDLCERGMLPAPFKDLVETIGITEVSDASLRMISDIVGLTEGQAIINRLMARMLDAILLSAEQAASIEGVDLPEDEDNDPIPPLTPPTEPEPIIPPAEPEPASPVNQPDDERAIARGLVGQVEPVAHTPPAEPEPAPPAPEPTPPAPHPLDHDGDGGKGGSKPGPESTAAKGAARKRTAKPKAKPKSKAKATRSSATKSK